eukprot:CAMPEP_0119190082 /NCGR_PEP_ID=MMETSP1316-20130426/1249_1 /TAXON_ID=41880 /ORGANISM="Pycnococcus provasolii, Strain RCC2336" /LENGTH=36 /DNA_ID= /DNA_START= /DNA_END= /DNA_ORIENTATION=
MTRGDRDEVSFHAVVRRLAELVPAPACDTAVPSKRQ